MRARYVDREEGLIGVLRLVYEGRNLLRLKTFQERVEFNFRRKDTEDGVGKGPGRDLVVPHLEMRTTIVGPLLSPEKKSEKS